MRKLRRLLREIFPKIFKRFDNSKDFWQRRYYFGGNSGKGSYGQEAQLKSEFLNSIIKEKGISHIVELGCGDGNNAQYYKIKNYTGLDVSKEAIKICQKKFRDKKHFKFYHANDQLDFSSAQFGQSRHRLCLSYDVIFHLVEDENYLEYLNFIERINAKYLLVYSTDFDEQIGQKHVRHRAFSKDLMRAGWKKILKKSMQENRKDFILFEKKSN